MKKFNPQCVNDMKDPLCHFYVRIYKRFDFLIEDIGVDKVNVSKGFESKFIEEVEARFIKWGNGEYRISFPFEGPGSQKPYNSDVKRLDILYGDKVTYKEWGEEYVFVLKIKVEKGFKSQCI
jgi:hypothetical protein